MRVTPTLVRAAEAMLRGGLEPMLASRAAHRQMEVASQVGPCKGMWHMQYSLLVFRPHSMSLPCNSRLCKFQCGTLKRCICCCAAVWLVCMIGWQNNSQRQLSGVRRVGRRSSQTCTVCVGVLPCCC